MKKRLDDLGIIVMAGTAAEFGKRIAEKPGSGRRS